MNKHHGSKFDDYLKKKGTYEEVKALAQKRWEDLQVEESSDTDELPGHLARFLEWLRRSIKQSPMP